MIPSTVSLTPGKRVLFLTKDPELIRRQLRGELDLRMDDLQVSDLLDDINTDAMTPAWVCFDHRPEDIARNAYAGLIVDGERLFPRGRADRRQLRGDRLRPAQGRRLARARPRRRPRSGRASGIAIAASFAPIHARNNINQGVLMGDHALLARLQAGEAIPLAEFTARLRPDHAHDHRARRPVPVRQGLARGEVALPPPDTRPRPMTMAEKILAAHLLGRRRARVREARRRRAACASTAATRHEFTTAQVHYFLERGVRRRTTRSPNPAKFAVFEDHLHLRRRRASDGAVLAEDRDAARPAARVPGAHRRARLLGAATASRPASATRSRASSSSTRATSSRPPTATPAWAAATTRSPGASARPSTRRWSTAGFTLRRGARVDPLRADGRAARRASRPRT